MRVTGAFDVSLTPLETHATGVDGITLGRLGIRKTFHGPLEAESRGEMLSALTPEKGSAGYVAIEQVQGVLDGRRGSFVLQHFGVMAQGADRLVLEVVPGSGTGELAGLAGEMRILREGAQHRYEFDVRLP